MHFILCDAIDSGKSTFVAELVRSLRAEGHMVRGWVTPARIVGGRKVGHDFVALAKGKMGAPIIFTRQAPFERSFAWRNFHFSELAFARSHDIEPSADLFVMDEIGPLELEEGGGFIQVARRAVAIAPTTLTVLRKGLQERFIEAMGITEYAIYSLTSSSELVESLKRALARPVRRL